MSLLYERRKIARTWDPNGIVPRAQRVIDGFKKSMNKFRIQGASDYLFNVYEVNTPNRWTVNLTTFSCSCCVWDLTGIPCMHAVSIILQTRIPWAEFCSPFHRLATYLEAYSGFITPMKQMQYWGESAYEVLPPIILRPAGRPKKQRRRDADEGPSQPKPKKRCSKCLGFGHNSRTCKGAPQPGARAPKPRAQPTTQPRARAQPTVSQPSASQLPSSQAGSSQPRARARAQPTVSQPTVSQPSASQLPSSQAGSSQPTISQPSSSQPTVRVAGNTGGCMTYFGRNPTRPHSQVFKPSKLVPRRSGK